MLKLSKILRTNVERRDDHGLTLIELLIVIALVGIVAGIALPILLNVLGGAKSSAAADSTNGVAKFISDWTSAGYTVAYVPSSDPTFGSKYGNDMVAFTDNNGNGTLDSGEPVIAQISGGNATFDTAPGGDPNGTIGLADTGSGSGGTGGTGGEPVAGDMSAIPTHAAYNIEGGVTHNNNDGTMYFEVWVGQDGAQADVNDPTTAAELPGFVQEEATYKADCPSGVGCSSLPNVISDVSVWSGSGSSAVNLNVSQTGWQLDPGNFAGLGFTTDTKYNSWGVENLSLPMSSSAISVLHDTETGYMTFKIDGGALNYVYFDHNMGNDGA